jgi:hypothetical protein
MSGTEVSWTQGEEAKKCDIVIDIAANVSGN